ncbi:MAG: TIGR03087 family PEP-CTERM/XrtA system glycosyltransferase [Novosphingobium sp.]|nr:TIGR03087 family PEP-CTERM/XrtA system glycosyltransferase [Novosphingobium sp.]
MSDPGGEILFLAHRVPFPPDRGDKIRSHHILKALAGLAPVHVATLGDNDSDMAHDAELAEVAASHCLIRREKPLWRAGLEALARNCPVSLAAFHNSALAAYVEKTLSTRPIDTIYVFSGQMGQYVPHDFKGRVLLDLVDVDSAKFDEYATRGFALRRWIHAREGRLLKSVEESMSARACHTLLVSEAEADLFRSRIGTPADHTILALGNGIDAGFFDPGVVRPHPEIASAPGPHIVFTGQMDYAPNVAAAHMLLGAILPALRHVHPEAMAHVVGRNPAPSLLQYDGAKGARVWGGVPDMRPFLAAADVACVPLSLARGVQNKVLEAMAMACPVVVSETAATGIGAKDGAQFAIAYGPDGFVARILELLAHRTESRAMGRAARAFVIEQRSWPAMLAALPMLAARGASQVRLVDNAFEPSRHVA